MNQWIRAIVKERRRVPWRGSRDQEAPRALWIPKRGSRGWKCGPAIILEVGISWHCPFKPTSQPKYYELLQYMYAIHALRIDVVISNLQDWVTCLPLARYSTSHFWHPPNLRLHILRFRPQKSGGRNWGENPGPKEINRGALERNLHTYWCIGFWLH